MSPSRPRDAGAHIVLCNPKFAHNVGGVLRAASCFRSASVWFTGDRVSLDAKGGRLPREERMKGYKDVMLRHGEYPFDFFKDHIPVALEVRPNSEQLPQFEHPENAVYVFGPEDGSIPKTYLRHCHRFVIIPTAHCVNLSAAVYLVLYDRLLKRQAAGLEPVRPSSEVLDEPRGPVTGWGDHEDLDALEMCEPARIARAR